MQSNSKVEVAAVAYFNQVEYGCAVPFASIAYRKIGKVRDDAAGIHSRLMPVRSELRAHFLLQFRRILSAKCRSVRGCVPGHP